MCVIVDVLQAKYSAACAEREKLREQVGQVQVEMEQLREASERRVASERIEVSQRGSTTNRISSERIANVCRFVGCFFFFLVSFLRM